LWAEQARSKQAANSASVSLPVHLPEEEE
jgi:hypothetical protein